MFSKDLVSMVKRQDRFKYFETKVDEIRDFAPDYYKVIKKPISLEEITEKIEGGYCDDWGIVEDLLQMFRNAMTYNPSSHPVHKEARRIRDLVIKRLSKVDETFEAAYNLWVMAN